MYGFLEAVHEHRILNKTTLNRALVEAARERVVAHGPSYLEGMYRKDEPISLSEKMIPSRAKKCYHKYVLFKVSQHSLNGEHYFLCYTNYASYSEMNYGWIYLVGVKGSKIQVITIYSRDHDSDFISTHEDMYDYLFTMTASDVRRLVEPTEPDDVEDYWGRRALRLDDERFYDYKVADEWEYE